MRFSNINNKLKKYQPVIQTIGIAIVFIALLISIWQSILTRRSNEISNLSINTELTPKWKVSIVYDSEDKLLDKLNIESLNSNLVLQNFKLVLFDRTKSITFTSQSSELNTLGLKNCFINIYKKYYSLENDFIYEPDELDYPVAVNFKYEFNGQIIDTVAIYKYYFKLYSSFGELKIKSMGLEFVKYISSNENDILKEVISYNIKNSFLSNIPESIYGIKEELIEKDSLLNILLSFVKINLSFEKKVTVFKNKNTDTVYCNAILYKPLYLIDDTLNKRRLLYISKINLNRKSFDKDLMISFDSIVKENGLFDCKNYYNNPINDKRKNIIINEKDYNYWYSLNKNLRQLLYRKVKL